jgi:hypothetical protein
MNDLAQDHQSNQPQHPSFGKKAAWAAGKMGVSIYGK